MPPNHPKDAAVEETVLIVGSGPIGATFARQLVDAGIKVLMIDMGEQGTRRVGDHKKNSVAVQKDISLFTNIVRGELSRLSVPTDTQSTIYLDPASWSGGPLQFVLNGQNPDQMMWDNMPHAAASRVVGGMGSHWTCCTPEEHPKIERSTIFSPDEWDNLYASAKRLFHTNTTSFDKSIRHQLVKHVLLDAYKATRREFTSMPLACRRNQENKNYVEWTASATILGQNSEPSNDRKLFEIRPNNQCLRLELDEDTGQVAHARVKDILKDKTYNIKAKKYVICSGAVLTVGILVNSGFKDCLPALGHYMTEQSMAFCQVVLKRTLVDNVVNDPYHLGWTKLVKEHHHAHPKDPLPFPFNDPDPQVYTPLSEKHPWHTQIHRDAFGYGEVPANVDQRLVVDLRWYTYVKPTYDNWVEFKSESRDGFGMPQPTFHFRIIDEDAERSHAMMKDMVEVASHLGGYLPGAEPKYLPPGSALHITGTYRAGESKEDSVVDKFSKVWGQKDLYLGGCGVIPTQNACNPTLTAACFAIAAAEHLAQSLKKKG